MNLGVARFGVPAIGRNPPLGLFKRILFGINESSWENHPPLHYINKSTETKISALINESDGVESNGAQDEGEGWGRLDDHLPSATPRIEKPSKAEKPGIPSKTSFFGKNLR